MNFIALFIGVFIIKGIFLWILYARLGWKVLLLGFISSLAWYPLMTILYHETTINFWIILVLIMTCDVFIYYRLLSRSLIKSILTSIILNVIAIIYFLFLNG